MAPPEQPEFFAPQPSATPAQPARPKAQTDSDSRPFRPLAVRMRPLTLAEVVGQETVVGPDSLLPRLIAEDQFGSLLFYGPPGCGKTTLAEVIAHLTRSLFLRVNAVTSNVAELRETLAYARHRAEQRPILFIDEIHRFNRSQQDLLLPDVEAGNVRLIGATTQNPGFYVNAPLLSRSHLFRLQPVPPEAIQLAMERALADVERGLGARELQADPHALAALARMSDGDLRRALNALETLALALPIGGHLDQAVLDQFARERQIRYDAHEDEHYDTASAYIKSMRGGDPDAALYWLAKMLEGGEDPRFIARRLIILASEDVGLGDSRGLPLAMATYQACEVIGMPECRINLAHATVFLATAPKSNTAYMALGKAQESICNQGMQSVPLWLKDSHTKWNKSQGHGKGYLYSHEFPEAISGQDFMEAPQTFYQPGENGAEKAIAERLERWQSLKKTRKSDTAD